MSPKEVQGLMEKARRSLNAAERLLQHGDHDFAVSRAYYAMFYAAQALLLTRDVRRAKHSGVVAAFNERFIQTGELPRRLFLLFRDKQMMHVLSGEPITGRLWIVEPGRVRIHQRPEEKKEKPAPRTIAPSVRPAGYGRADRVAGP